ncbi:Isochorismatase-like protein [Aspergillus pseudoustus]|uniref:Isochorismatase-like protein n=1 Tax=Aspergillus pseudoustus TaxID=1810923 RepID=A0ABR4KSX9_9EURO
MHLQPSLLSTLPVLASYAAQCVAASSSAPLSFGQNYAVLNLDLINGVVAPLANTSEGRKWINSTATWIDAVHAQSPPPLSIYTRIYYSSPAAPELSPETPFYQVAASFGNLTETSPASEIYALFAPQTQNGGKDVVLRKSRYYAGDGNSLEEILRTRGVDTVILSGLRTSGVLLSTAYRLFDLDYFVYVIGDNTIQPDAPKVKETILEDILPGLPVTVITLQEALEALGNSGPARW